MSSKDVETAKELLAHLNMEQMPDFLDYALAEAGKTRFELQTLGGVKQYLNGYLQIRQQRTTAKATAAARQAEERQLRLRMDYDQYRRTAAADLFQRLPADEQAAIEALARSKSNSDSGATDYMSETLARMEKLRLIAERHAGSISSFEKWSASHGA